MKSCSRIFSITLMVITVAFFTHLIVKRQSTRKEIISNGEESICKFTYCRKFPKSTQGIFIYYIDGKLYKNNDGGCPDDYREKLKKFYVMRYSKTEPAKIVVDFSKQITDTTELLKAGFNMREIRTVE